MVLLPSAGKGLENPNCLPDLSFVVKSFMAVNSIVIRLFVSGDDVGFNLAGN